MKATNKAGESVHHQLVI